jgi:hypothetical protein
MLQFRIGLIKWRFNNTNNNNNNNNNNNIVVHLPVLDTVILAHGYEQDKVYRCQTGTRRISIQEHVTEDELNEWCSLI